MALMKPIGERFSGPFRNGVVREMDLHVHTCVKHPRTRILHRQTEPIHGTHMRIRAASHDVERRKGQRAVLAIRLIVFPTLRCAASSGVFSV